MDRAPTTRILNLTRLVSRAGRVLTGVDRVELAYLRRFLADDVPAYGLIRTSLGWLLLDRAGLQAFEAAVTRGDWGRAGWLARLSRRLSVTQQAAVSLARRHAVKRARPRGLAKMIAGLGDVDYYSVAHSNLTKSALEPFQRQGNRINVLIHDLIPLEWPELQRPETVALFRDKVTWAVMLADRIILNSQDTKDRLDAYIKTADLDPYACAVVAHLGVDVVPPVSAEVPRGLDLTRPYFVILGTIEPRKNHKFLLDLWERLGPDAPELLIVGSRGWRNEEVFARLDQGVPHVHELAGLSDGAIAALLVDAKALLFPSVAEGFGLPALEALALGCPVICGDLAIWREVLGDHAVYLDVTESYAWEKAINALSHEQVTVSAKTFIPPLWDAHFKIVLSMT